jgi:hypothetical protein
MTMTTSACLALPAVPTDACPVGGPGGRHACPYRSACSLPSREWCTTSQPIDPSSWVTGLASGPHAQSGSVMLVSWSTKSYCGAT